MVAAAAHVVSDFVKIILKFINENCLLMKAKKMNKKFMCSFCEKEVIPTLSVELHVKSCAEKFHKCYLCEKLFANLNGYSNHLVEVHDTPESDLKEYIVKYPCVTPSSPAKCTSSVNEPNLQFPYIFCLKK